MGDAILAGMELDGHDHFYALLALVPSNEAVHENQSSPAGELLQELRARQHRDVARRAAARG
jgi:hypothetical protein